MPTPSKLSDLQGMPLNEFVTYITGGLQGVSFQNEQVYFQGRCVSVTHDGHLSLSTPDTSGTQQKPSVAGKALLDKMIQIDPTVTQYISRSVNETNIEQAQQLLQEKGPEAIFEVEDWELKKAMLWELAENDPDIALQFLSDYQEEPDEVQYAFASRLQKHLRAHLRLGLLRFTDSEYPFRLVAEKLENGTSFAEKFNPSSYLSDYNLFGLIDIQALKEGEAAYCEQLSHWLHSKAPDYVQALQPVIDTIKNEGNLLSERDEQLGSRLLYIITILSSNKNSASPEQLEPFIKAVLNSRNNKNLDYLLPGLIELCRCPEPVRAIVCQKTSGGEQVMLSHLALLSFVPEILSQEQFQSVYKMLHKGGAAKRSLKDAKVFTNWLDTLQRLKGNTSLTKEAKRAMLETLADDHKKLNINLFALKVLMTAKPEYINQKVQLGEAVNLHKELDTIIAEEFGHPDTPTHVTPEIEWIKKSRVPALVPLYVTELRNSGDEHAVRMVKLFKDAVSAEANGHYGVFRHDSSDNPHLQKVHNKKPKMINGLVKAFSGFSDNIQNRLNPKETIEFTEDFQDMFLSGYDLYTCQSPDGRVRENKALLSYLVNGQNAMIAIKGPNGQIKARMIVRTLLRKVGRGKEIYIPVLFCDQAYPEGHSKEQQQLMKDAAKEIAAQTKLMLVKETEGLIRPGQARVELHPGKAPYEYLDFSSRVTPTDVVGFFAEKDN